jgi:hypothetical protein
VSEVSEGPGWWLASDGRWYRPEQAPGYVPLGVPLQGPHSGGGDATPVPPFSPGVPIPPSGYGPPPGPPGYAPPVDPGYGFPTGGPSYGYVPVQKTNGLAVASLVCSLVWLGGVGSLLAIVFGFIARSQIKRAEGNVQGNGLAIAGIIIGFAGLVATGLFVIFVVALVQHCNQIGNCTTNTYNFGN